MGMAYLLLGSNLGDKVGYLEQAKEQIQQQAGKVITVSPYYETAPWGGDQLSPFVNFSIALQTNLSPLALLHILLKIEAKLGRQRTKEEKAGYTDRTVDIDILLYDDLVLDSAELVLPHPRLHLRRFALVPLLDISNGLIHPLLGESIEALLKKCPDSLLVTKKGCNSKK